MKRMILIAASAALGLAGAAIAQDTPSATPMQGSPPMTNTPAGATSDASSMGSMDSGTASGAATAPATKPMAATGTTPSDPADGTAPTEPKKKMKKPKA